MLILSSSATQALSKLAGQLDSLGHFALADSIDAIILEATVLRRNFFHLNRNMIADFLKRRDLSSEDLEGGKKLAKIVLELTDKNPQSSVYADLTKADHDAKRVALKLDTSSAAYHSRTLAPSLPPDPAEELRREHRSRQRNWRREKGLGIF